jgi:phospholipid/cholesterol/gamma-HCH transport system substrate-binding protein
MQKSKQFKIRLGASVVAAAIILLGSIYYISKNQDIFVDSFRLCAVFPSMGGLQIGDKVRFDGIDIGTVDGVRIVNDSSVIIYFLIEEQMQPFIKRGSSAMISAEGLMGSKTLSILPNAMDNRPVQPDDTLTSLQPVSVDDIINNIKITAGNAQLIAQNVAYISTKMKGGKGMVGKMMYDKRFSRNLDTAMTNFKGAQSNLEQTEESVPAENGGEKIKKGFHPFRKKNQESDSIKKE